MKTKGFFTIVFAMSLCLSATTYQTRAQEPTAKKGKNQPVAPQAASNPVVGSGSPGRLSKWTGVSGTETYSLGNSNIFEDKFGKVGIGTDMPTSKLTVAGVVESTSGGVKFPDGTVQTTSAAGALVTVAHDATLTGDGTQASPLGVASPLEVRDQDNPARQPVSFKFTGPFTVPAGKRLVIEYVSGFFNRLTTANLQPVDNLNILITTNSVQETHYVLGHRTHIDPPNQIIPSQTSYVVAQSVRLYADPGTQVTLFGRSPEYVSAIMFSGYFVNVP